MPIYEYRCPDCSHEFERIQKMSEDPVRVCPECEKENVSKLLSSPSFHLKGGGWYNDHYGLKSGASDSSTSSTKTEAAPEATPAAPATPAPCASCPATKD